MKTFAILLVAGLVAHPAFSQSYYGSSGGYYGSTGGGYYGSTGGGYYGSTGGYYGSSGPHIIDFLDDRFDHFDTDEDIVEEYYEGWQEASHNTYATRRTIPGAAGEESLAFTRDCLWFNWKAPKDGCMSFSTRGSQSTPDWGCDTRLAVYRVVSPQSLLNSGAYWRHSFYDTNAGEWREEHIALTGDTVTYGDG